MITIKPARPDIVVGARTQEVIGDILNKIGVSTITVTSAARSPEQQAAAMFENCLRTLFDTQYAIYAGPGRAVLKVLEKTLRPQLQTVFETNKALVTAAMTTAIVAQGPSSVSKHCLGPDAPIEVHDFAKNSLPTTKWQPFTDACRSDARVVKLLDENDCFHVEILKAVTS